VVACCRWMRENRGRWVDKRRSGGGGGGGPREREMMQSAGKQGCDRVRYLPHRLTALFLGYRNIRSNIYTGPTWERGGRRGTLLDAAAEEGSTSLALQAIGEQSGGGDWRRGDVESEGGDSSVSLCWMGTPRPSLPCARFLGVGRWAFGFGGRYVRLTPLEGSFVGVPDVYGPLCLSKLCFSWKFQIVILSSFPCHRAFSAPLANRSSNTTF
jgi:hypothetical protein